MRRGEIWWAELPRPIGFRPVVILTRNAVVNSIGSLTVALVTRKIRHLHTEVVLDQSQGLTARCVANLDNIVTVPRELLTRQMGSCDAEKLGEIERAVKLALELP